MTPDDHPVVTVLGGVSTRIDGRVRRLSRARRHLLAVLVAAGPNGLSADHLAEELWSGQPPNQWDPSLRMAVSRLRRDLPSGALPAGDGRYYLDLPTEDVDLWVLQSLAEDAEAWVDSARHLDLLRANQPFEGIEVTTLLQLATDRVRSYRTQLFERMVQSDQGVDQLAADELRAHAQGDPLNETLALLSAQADAGAGRPQRALDTLEACRRALRDDLGADPDAAVQAFTEQLRKGAAGPSTERPLKPLPAALAAQLDPPLVGREDLLAQLLTNAPCSGAEAPGVLLLTGPSGVGKSRLAAAVANSLHEKGVDIRYGEAEPHSEIAFGPLATLSSAVFSAIGQIMTDGGDPQVRAAAVWSRVLQLLEEDDGRPFVAVIDDAHWLDTQTRDLLLFLTRAPITTDNGLIIIGSDDVDLAPWHDLKRALQASGRVAAFEVERYTSDDLLGLVDARFSRRSLPARRNLAAQLADLSGGNPAIAESILNSVDPETLRPRDLDALDPEQAVVDLVRSLSKEARQVGGAAAVLGRTFDLDLVVALTTFDVPTVLAGLEELSENRLVHELKTPNLFRFDNLLVQRAVETTMLDARRRQAHAAAAELVTSAHQRASHLAAAVPTVEASLAVEALYQSALNHLNDGNSSEAVRAAQAAEQISAEPLPANVLVVYASALDRTGASGHAAEVRGKAFEEAAAAHDWALALDAAMSGLPAAERADGDAERLALLQRMPISELDREQAFILAMALARQSFLVDDVEAARDWAELGAERSHSLIDAAQASTARWLIDRHSSDPTPRDRWYPPGPIDELAEEHRVSVLHPLTIEAIEYGELDVAQALLNEMDELSTRLRDPLGSWRSMLLRATLGYLAGDFEAADSAAHEANELGFAFGVVDAEPAFIAQLWLKSWLLGQHGGLAPLFETADEQLFRTDLARAARACSRFAAGDTDRAREEMGELLNQLRARGSAFGPCVSVVLLEPVLALGQPADTDLLRRTLLPWRGRLPVVGNGIACLGPVDYHLSQLVPAEQQAGLLRSSLDLVQSAGVVPWEIRVGQRLAQVTDDPDLESTTRSMAEDTVFEALLPD